MIPLSTVLIPTAKHHIRIVSSRNQHTGVETIHPPRKSLRRRIGRVAMYVAGGCAALVMVIGVLL